MKRPNLVQNKNIVRDDVFLEIAKNWNIDIQLERGDLYNSNGAAYVCICPDMWNIEEDMGVLWEITGNGKSVCRAFQKGLLTLSEMSYECPIYQVTLRSRKCRLV